MLESLTSRSQRGTRCLASLGRHLFPPPAHLVGLLVKMFLFFQGSQRKFGKYREIKGKGEQCGTPPSSQVPSGMKGDDAVCLAGVGTPPTKALDSERRGLGSGLPSAMNVAAISGQCPRFPLSSSSLTNPAHPALCSLATKQAATPRVGFGAAPGHTLVK